jgi:hypothetical protein
MVVNIPDDGVFTMLIEDYWVIVYLPFDGRYTNALE